MIRAQELFKKCSSEVLEIGDPPKAVELSLAGDHKAD